MPGHSPQVWKPDRELVLVAAAPAEAAALAGCAVEAWVPTPVAAGVVLVRSGVGKANAAGAAARVLDPGRHGAVLSIGIAGALPGSGLAIGDVVIATGAWFADEGVRTPEGFEELSSRGFPAWGGEGPKVPADPALAAWAARALPGARMGDVATVSVCSGTDALAAEIAARTGAIAEAMEGAGVGASAARVGVAFGEVRVISNTTGDRPGQRWDLRGSLETLGRAGRMLCEAWSAAKT
jgi:futalosine hydrolase